MQNVEHGRVIKRSTKARGTSPDAHRRADAPGDSESIPMLDRESEFRSSRLRASRSQAFTLTELVVILACIAVLAGLLLPVWSRARDKSRRIDCVSNLKQIGLSFKTFAIDHGARLPMQVLTNQDGALAYPKPGGLSEYYGAVSNELVAPRILICPSDTRKPAASFASLTDSNISYFIGCDTAETLPQALLAGDRNLEANGQPVPPGLFPLTTNLTLGWTKDMHHRMGNVALGDGSVQQLTSARLNAQPVSQGIATNWLLVP